MGNVALIQFNEIRVPISRKFIIRCFNKKTYLTREEILKLRQKQALIEKNINRLKHLHSIVEQSLLKSFAIKD